jgi:hypothetical protein
VKVKMKVNTMSNTTHRFALRLAVCAVALLSTALGLSACSAGFSKDDDQKSQVRRDNEKLEAQFNLITGTYRGELKTYDTRVKGLEAELSLYILMEEDGVNSDGSKKARPALHGRFQLVDAVTDTDLLTLGGDYDARTGSLILTSPKGAVQLSLRGSAVSERVQLDITRLDGQWGRYNATRISTQASAAAGGDIIDRRDRLLSVYRKVDGFYDGIVSGPSGTRSPIQIDLMAVEHADASGLMLPQLVAQLRWLHAPDGIGERNLLVDYNSVTGVISMRESSSTSSSTTPGAAMFSGSGTLIDGKLSIRFFERRGELGQFTAQRRDRPQQKMLGQ